MKILVFTDEFPPLSRGGSGMAAERECLGLLEVPEVHLTVVLPDRVGSPEVILETARYRVVSLPLPDFRDRPWKFMFSFFRYRELKAFLKEFDPDIVHCHHVTHSLSFFYLYWLTRVYPVLFTVHDVGWLRPSRIVPKAHNGRLIYHPTRFEAVVRYRSYFNPLLEFLTRVIFLRARAIVYVSSVLQSCYDTFLRSAWSVYRLPHALDLSVWRPERSTYSASEPLRIGFAGRISSDKGWDIFLYIVRSLKSRGLLVEGRFIGDPEQARLVLNRLDTALQQSIVFDGKKVSEASIREWMTSLSLIYGGSVCVDSFLNVVIEALASGVPAIVGPYTGSREIMDIDCGLVLEPDDLVYPERIVDRLTAGGIQANLARWRAHIVAPEVRARFDMKTHIAELMKIYQSVLKKD